jgi:hypothetical protein
MITIFICSFVASGVTLGLLMRSSYKHYEKEREEKFQRLIKKP